MIHIEHVTKKFGRFVALDDVSLHVAAGEAVALWGPNGAGKSTLIRCLLGLLPFRGNATIAGLDVRKRGKSARRLVGYLPQEPALFDDLRVAEVTLLFAQLNGASADQARRMLAESSLAPHVKKRVRELSGGMKQRLSLGLALLTDPPILLLDEPTSNLDSAGRQELLNDVEGLRQAGKTVLLISHRPEEVRRIADRIVTLESGRVVSIDDTTRPDQAGERTSVLVEPGDLSAAVDLLRGAGIGAEIQTAPPNESMCVRPQPRLTGGDDELVNGRAALRTVQ